MNTYHIIRYIKLSLFFFKKSLYFFFLCYCSSVKKRIAIFLFDEIELLDFAGPLEVFSSARLEKKKSANITNLPKAFEVFTVTEKKKTIHTSDGLKVFSNYNFLSCPNFNILILPGGIGTRSLIKNTVVIIDHFSISLNGIYIVFLNMVQYMQHFTIPTNVFREIAE